LESKSDQQITGKTQELETVSARADGTDSEPWRRLTLIDHVVVMVTLVLVAGVAWSWLPKGICIGDAGELQLVACVLGITHAPGYPIYASLGFPLTLIPGVEPTFMITLGCFASGLMVVWLCLVTQIRLGVGSFAAGTMGLLFVAHGRTWVNLVAPEVYMPTLALQAGSAYLMVKYERLGRRCDLIWSCVLYGTALANRPPVLFTLPFLLLGWWYARRVWGSRRPRAVVRSFAVCTLFAALPGLYALGYLYVRDTHETHYNYIEQHNREYNMVPDLDEGVRAKIHRVLWHVSGREFDYAIGNDWRGVWNKLRWFSREFYLHQPVSFFIGTALTLIGAYIGFRRERAAFWLLAGMIVGSFTFLCAYRMSGQAADYMPLLWASLVFLGVATLPLREWAANGAFRYAGVTAWTIMGVFTLTGDWVGRPAAALAGDAADYVRDLEFASLPESAVVVTVWPETPVVYYEQFRAEHRSDITIVPGATKNWESLLKPYADRPLFAASPDAELTQYRQVPYRNIWRLEPVDPPVVP
jgi:uncharacterized membrane protein (UPF0136 family)